MRVAKPILRQIHGYINIYYIYIYIIYIYTYICVDKD